MKNLNFWVLFTLAATSQAFENSNNVNRYYGKEFSGIISTLLHPTCQQSSKVDKDTLKSKLTHILASSHVRSENDYDVLVENCETNSENCFSHKVLGYKGARIELFGKIHLQATTNADQEKNYFIKDIYCLKNYTNQDMPENAKIGPGLIPEHTVLNTEHVWPKSRFKNNEEKETGEMYEMKVSDLHILYPSDEDLNSMRSNYEFGEVKVPVKTATCSSAKLGYLADTDRSKLYFEPPSESKGNVARSIFYFSVRYNVPINDVEESFLRKWNKEDPIDLMEMLRNTSISELENVRNPFIDYPSIVDSVNNF